MKFFLGFMVVVLTTVSAMAGAYVWYMWDTVGVPAGELEKVLLAHFGLFLLLSVTLSFWVLLARED